MSDGSRGRHIGMGGSALDVEEQKLLHRVDPHLHQQPGDKDPTEIAVVEGLYKSVQGAWCQ